MDAEDLLDFLCLCIFIRRLYLEDVSGVSTYQHYPTKIIECYDVDFARL